MRPAACVKTRRPCAIRLDEVSLVYETADGPVRALSDIKLQIDKGDFVALIGPSGCGKTTLLRVIADLEPCTGGATLVNDQSPREARLSRCYGYVFQTPTLLPWRTVEKNIHLPLEVMGFPKQEQRRRAQRYLDMVNLGEFGKKFPWQLSGGMQQRVSIARALCFDPDILLMDEPFGALDEITRDRLNEQLLQLWSKTRKTVVFVTHSIPEAVFLATKVVVMSARPGRITDTIACDFSEDRGLDIRDTPKFREIARRVREQLHQGHAD